MLIHSWLFLYFKQLWTHVHTFGLSYRIKVLLTMRFSVLFIDVFDIIYSDASQSLSLYSFMIFSLFNGLLLSK